jgi:predicted transcriptional regulator
MLFYRYTSRPARYGAILAHTLSEYLNNINVDLSSVEDSLADKVVALSAKVDELEARLLAYDESIDETPVTKPKAKRKAKPRAKK